MNTILEFANKAYQMVTSYLAQKLGEDVAEGELIKKKIEEDKKAVDELNNYMADRENR